MTFEIKGTMKGSPLAMSAEEIQKGIEKFISEKFCHVRDLQIEVKTVTETKEKKEIKNG
jgi:hypothetical protein